MKKHYYLLVAFIAFFVFCLVSSACKETENQIFSRSVALSSNWMMQSDEIIKDAADSAISRTNYNTESWHKAIVPGTVLGSMATNGEIEDPYFGINMQKVDPEQFKQPWWFRTSFNLTDADLKKTISLRFNGINYRADLWLNGKKVAGRDVFAGTYRMFTFNINDYAVEGENVIALKMWQHADGEYSIGFVDWNPLPRDRNLGIFREVFLEINEGIKIRSPFVYSKVNKENCRDADLFIQTELINSTEKLMAGTLRVDYEIGIVEKKVKLIPGETLTCSFTPEEFPELSVRDVDLWWPNGMGKPNLYKVKVEFVAGKRILDREERRYGIREIAVIWIRIKTVPSRLTGNLS